MTLYINQERNEELGDKIRGLESTGTMLATL